ncbi:MAG: sigma-54 dependent transcriptional regulator [Deferrisomatales bacterium]
MEHILIVDDEPNYCTVLAQLFEDEGYRALTATNPFAALECLAREPVDAVLSDLKMARMDGLALLGRIREDHPGVPVLVLTAYATVESALEAMRLGAFDYLTKPFRNEQLLLAVEKALAHRRLHVENEALRRELRRLSGQEILGCSAAVRALTEQIAKIAPAPSAVLITGETGTGKELVARALHRVSPRAEGPMVTVNCAALPATLLESELFGHEKGAFTGASESKRGLLEMADGGTLFLDEIGDFPLRLQPKLLRVLEDKRFRRVGGTVELSTDVRVVAATNRDLPAMIEEGRFREDLYYRLNVVSLHVPPLRERREDISLLVLHFLRQAGPKLGRRVTRVDPETMRRLEGYPWPGNARELRNVIERGVLFCDGDTLTLDCLPAALVECDAEGDPTIGLDRFAGRSLPEALEAVERELIHRALVRARGVQARAAEILGIRRSTLQYKLKKYGLGP